MDRRHFIRLFSSVALVNLAKFPLPKEKIRITNHLPVIQSVDDGGDTVRDGWMLCDGRSLDINQYRKLFKTMGNYYGGSLKTHKFNIPDCRGHILEVGEGALSDAPLNFIMPFMKVCGRSGVPIGTICHLSCSPDNVEVDEGVLG